MNRWFRWYEGTSEDGKFRVIARNASVTVATVMGVWAVVLEDASHPDHRGVAVRGEDFYAAILDLEDAQLTQILGSMEDAGIISVGHDAITVTKWKERQFENDTKDGTNADRQRKWRDKRKQNAPVTVRNGSVTDTKRPDTDTDTDTERKNIGRSPTATRPTHENSFEEFWKAYPKRSGANPKHPARALFLSGLKAGASVSEIVGGARAFALRESEKIGTEFIPQATTWLRQRRWQDYAVSEDKPPGPIGWEPGMPTDAELRAQYAERESKTEVKNECDRPSEAEGNRIRNAGDSVHESQAECGREGGKGDDLSRHKTGNGRMESLGNVFSRIPGLRAACDDANS